MTILIDHTPTPWRMEKAQGSSRVLLVGPQGSLIISAQDSWRENDLAFIVAAVNAYACSTRRMEMKDRAPEDILRQQQETEGPHDTH